MPHQLAALSFSATATHNWITKGINFVTSTTENPEHFYPKKWKEKKKNMNINIIGISFLMIL